MKLYYSRGACSLAPRIIINELGLSCDYESVDIKSKHKKTETGEDFLSINPKGSVPVLVTDNGEILTENAVILQYLANQSFATQLLPAIDNFNHYRVLEWLNYVATEMHKSAGVLFHTGLPQEVKDQYFIPILKSKLEFLNKHLENKKYLCSDEFTLPDAYLFVVLSWLYVFKIDISQWPNLKRYTMDLRKRPSIQQSLKDESLIDNKQTSNQNATT